MNRKHAGMGVTAAANGPLPELSTVRILLVDDDVQAEALIELALVDARFDWMVEVAPTAAAGLTRIKADEHDIYLIDQQLPDGTGIDLIARSRSGATSKPCILLTGYGSGAIDDAASRAGAADYVEKQLVSAQLERSIRYALRNWQAARMLHDREEQLRQAQKMEAIGRLAGGVAHDFNNLLTAIIGYTDLIGEHLDPDGPAARDVTEIRRAAERAASLTNQLLAFSRKQYLDPTVIDLNDIVTGLLQMLPRVIGEHIQTRSDLDASLSHVRADASQMEQVFVNLVLNARDAMPGGGDLRIRTENVELSAEQLAAESLALAPGRYVVLSISDTGTGMDAATRERAFEPFFTTKPKGKGTGLGLATVYGIVQQSGGGIALRSTPGAGTTVAVYLPVTAEAQEPRRPETPAAAEGSETLLVVEDNDAVRELTVKALRRRGYAVHEARSGEEALALMGDAARAPDLLITDVVMPGMSGPALAERLLRTHDTLRVLYVSGYTEDVGAAHGSFLDRFPLLQKPYTPGKLAQRVRAILDEEG